MNIDSALAAAWTRAADILGIDVVVPYSPLLPSGVRVAATALVRSFGANVGMLIVTDYSRVCDIRRELEQEGYGFAVFEEPVPTESFDVDEYIEILRDWGWAGKAGDEPPWIATQPCA